MKTTHSNALTANQKAEKALGIALLKKTRPRAISDAIEPIGSYFVDDEIVRVGNTYFLPAWIPRTMTLEEVSSNAIPYSQLSDVSKARVALFAPERLKLALDEERKKLDAVTAVTAPT